MCDVSQALRKASACVLEDWGLMLVDDIPKPALILETFQNESLVYVSSVNISGTIKGEVSMWTRLPFMQILAANVLGKSTGDVSSSEALDAFREMGNVLAGNFITEGFGEASTFDLLSPTIRWVAGTDCSRLKVADCVIGYMADDESILFAFTMNS